MQNRKKVTIFYLKRTLYKVTYGRQRIRFFFFAISKSVLPNSCCAQEQKKLSSLFIGKQAVDSLICSPVLFTISFFSRVREQFSNHSILYPEGRAFISVSDKCLSIQLLVLTKILVFFKALKKRSGMHQCD